MTYKCPKCGGPVKEGIHFCKNCGQEFKWPKESITTLNETEPRENINEPSELGSKYYQVDTSKDNSNDLNNNSTIEKFSEYSISKVDKIIYAIITLLAAILLYVPGYYSRCISVNGKPGYMDESFCKLLDFSHDFLGNVVVGIITFILLFILFVFISPKRKLKNTSLICVIGSAISTLSIILFSIVDALSIDLDLYIYGDHVLISFDGFEIIFIFEILLLIALTVISVLNHIGKPISTMFRK